MHMVVNLVSTCLQWLKEQQEHVSLANDNCGRIAEAAGTPECCILLLTVRGTALLV